MSDAQVQAAKAARIKEDLGSFLDDIERDEIERALASPRTNDEGRAQAEDALRTVTVIRSLRGKLEASIMHGAQVAKTEQAGRRVA